MITRRTALTTLGAIGASAAIPSLSLANRTLLAGPIKLGVIADLHGGLAVDAEARLDSFLEAMSERKVRRVSATR